MFAKLLARLAMVLSMAYFTLALVLMFAFAVLGEPQALWEMLEIEESTPPPPLWSLMVSAVVALFILVALGLAYWFIEKILRGGATVGFDHLSRYLRGMAFGLMGFWIGIKMLDAVLPYLLTRHLSVDIRPPFDWDQLDLDIVLLIISVAIYAISQSLDRASLIEEEHKHFL